jgi:transposase-like protein
MMETATAKTEPIIEARPPCPHCGKPDVKLAGKTVRSGGDRVQNYKCRGCRKSFIEPSRVIGRLGREPRKEKAFRLREAGLSFPQIAREMNVSEARARQICNRKYLEMGSPRATNLFEVSVRACLLKDLSEMFSIARGSGPGQQSFESFCSELIECAVIDFRTRKIDRDTLPLGLIPTPTIPVRTHRGLLSETEVAKVQHLVGSGTMNIPAAAKRFHCCSNTVARALSQANGNGNENGNGH